MKATLLNVRALTYNYVNLIFVELITNKKLRLQHRCQKRHPSLQFLQNCNIIAVFVESFEKATYYVTGLYFKRWRNAAWLSIIYRQGRYDWIVYNFCLLFVRMGFEYRSRSHVTTDGQSVSQSVCQSIEPSLRLVTRYYFLSEGSLWREVGSVIWLSQSIVIYQHLHQAVQQYIYNLYKASFSPVSVQQIMLY
jgi:hypothetical protein